ncbi:MAG: hypothetical protein FWE82_04650 [Defluviitaleaceae bacterium]|nr:hypothetical protein [Defluviitaleaceae bacterium]
MEKKISGLLYSQIGYDLHDPKRAVVRESEKKYGKLTFEILEYKTLKPVYNSEAECWGEKWGSFWWVLDFTELNVKGEYIIKVYEASVLIYQSEAIEIAEWLLWNKTVPMVLYTQFEERKRLARNGNGWRDCGTEWREVSSICGGIIGLADMIELASPLFDTEETAFVMEQLKTGCEYLCLCQERAADLGYPAGCVTHEFPGYMNIIPGDTLASIVSWSKTARLIYEHDREASNKFLSCAESAYQFILNGCKPHCADGFSSINHGAQEGFIKPDEFMTRDLFFKLWGAYELYLAGKRQYKDDIFKFADEAVARQIPKEKSEGGLYGHFYTFGAEYNLSEKSNVHHHVGHDTGGIYPHYIVPLMHICGHFYQHENVSKWRGCVENFAYGYLLPACEANPFRLLPVGYFEGHGLLWFCGPWHGINATYGYAATLALNLEGFCNDMRFRDIAVSQLQWIAGLNSGNTKKSFDGCVLWSEDIPDGTAVPMSQIDGVGRRYVKSWSGIPGSIDNGFSANIQFTHGTPNSVENDVPVYYCDEDWVPHSGGWLGALGNLFNRKRFRKP